MTRNQTPQEMHDELIKTLWQISTIFIIVGSVMGWCILYTVGRIA